MSTETRTIPAVEEPTLSPQELRRRELSLFLRDRRERISPEQVGLPIGNRRRTPGLRREEVAQLSGVGVTWYTWLEQGRDIQVSDSVIDAISRTLQLTAHERSHLYVLSGSQAPPVERECSAVSPQLRILLDQLEPFPAVVQNARYDLLAYNRTYNRLVGNLDEIAPEDRNALLLAFTKPCWREVLLDWESGVSRMVAQYRAAMAEHLDDSVWKCLVKRLRNASPEFTELWQRHEITAPENCTKRFLHRDVGLMKFSYTNLWTGPRSETRMLAYIPIDDETTERLHKLYEMVRG
ncbi:MAG TPA: helix-turn-helix transcriptional regulator [Mycobacteriales bacterium]|nr:helix-turn-helix transcriptional regulator [Mycobacteriales bacterium]